MAQQYDNTNKGVLFREREKKSDKHPDFTGKLDVDGKEYRLAGWFKESRNGGNKFISLSVSEPKEQAGDGGGFRQQSSGDDGW